MNIRTIFAVLAVANLAACAEASAVRVSQSELMIESSADPSCGGVGAFKVAQQQAAIETIKAGYDSFRIEDSQSANNTYLEEHPGYYQTYRRKDASGDRYSETTYRPGYVLTRGHRNQQLVVRMFRFGERGGENAIPAKQSLGPGWPRIVRDGISGC
jgi:hypothetical protein